MKLIVPDIHTRWAKAEKIVEDFGADETYFLGDYFDNFDDGTELAQSTAEWLKESLKKKNRFHIIGNHDVNYYIPHLQRCSGFSWKKYKVIREILSVTDFYKLYTHIWLNDYILLSHAGYSRHYVHPIKGLTKGVTADWDRKAALDIDARELPEIFWCGQDRFGGDLYSGIVWLDWNFFEPIEGICQIVGHTPDRQVRRKENNWCIDTHLKHVMLIDDDFEMEVVEV
jgi:hypothetical protein